MKDATILPRFERAQKDSFRKVLTQRVRDYFSDNNISQKGNRKMVWKTVGMLALYFVPYVLMLTLASSWWAVLGLFFMMGIGMSGIGMGVMHDALHGAYHQKPGVNKFIGSVIYLISGNAENWKVQHNILHHTYTNIEGLDEDMETSGLLRLHPSQPWKKFHKFQKFYMPFVYSLLTINWVTTKDFKQLITFSKRGLGSYSKENMKKEWTVLIGTKLLYFSLFVALPLILVPVAWYWVLLGFLLMHFVAGFVLSFVFQLAHMVEGVETHAAPQKDATLSEWMVHQLNTTANFARNNKLINWFVGGLNYQVEHHLFPNICHVHYPELSKIVEKTAHEFGLVYNEHKRMAGAIRAHLRHVSLMSQPPQLQPLTA